MLLTRLADDVSEASTTARLSLAIADVPIELRVSNTAFAGRLRSAFRGFERRAAEEPGNVVEVRLHERPGIWRDESAEPRVSEADQLLLVEHRDFVGALAQDASRMSVLQPGRVLSTENALRVLLAAALTRRGGLLLHAAGVVQRGAATVLFGRSGSGKSTSARLARGRPVLGDDLVALTRDRDGWRAHSTPFGGPSARRRKARSAPLRSLLRLRHGATFELRAIGQAQAVSELLQSTVLPAATDEQRQRALGLCADLAEAVHVRELRFPVDHGLWRWLGERGV